MMKVQDFLGKRTTSAERKGEDDRRQAIASKEIPFEKQLQKFGEQHGEERLAAMLEGIGKQGEKLAKNLDIKELKRYKKLISEFLFDTTQQSFQFNKQNVLDRRGRFRNYAVINKVNEHLDQLTQEMLKGEKDNIKILGRIDEIRGLLMDIML